MVKIILAVIAGRYYPEYNGQAKIFHGLLVELLIMIEQK